MRFLRGGNPVLALSLTLGSLALAGTTATTMTAAPASAATAASSCTGAPTYSSTTTAFGDYQSPTGVYSSFMTSQDVKWGFQNAVRVYNSTTPPDNAWTRKATSLAGRIDVESFRMPPADVIAGKYDATMLNWFKTAPTTQPIMWSYYHEPEPHILAGEFTSAQYKAAWQHLVGLEASLCRTNLYPTLILTGYTADPKSKRNWQDYYPGSDYISVMAFDPYNSVSKAPTQYTDPATLYAPVVAVAKAAGKPLGIAETGSRLVAGDNGTQRAAWLTKVGAYFKSQNAAFCLYWDSVGKDNRDFRLTDATSQAAWKAVMATS